MHTVVDAVALIAAIDRREAWHRKADRIFRELPKPLFTCEAAIAETCYVFGSSALALDSVMTLLSSRSVCINFSLSNEVASIERLLRKYNDVPMSLADACLVRMSEIFDAPVFTFDADFRIYSRNRRNVIPLIGIDN